MADVKQETEEQRCETDRRSARSGTPELVVSVCAISGCCFALGYVAPPGGRPVPVFLLSVLLGIVMPAVLLALWFRRAQMVWRPRNQSYGHLLRPGESEFADLVESSRVVSGGEGEFVPPFLSLAKTPSHTAPSLSQPAIAKEQRVFTLIRFPDNSRATYHVQTSQDRRLASNGGFVKELLHKVPSQFPCRPRTPSTAVPVSAPTVRPG